MLGAGAAPRHTGIEYSARTVYAQYGALYRLCRLENQIEKSRCGHCRYTVRPYSNGCSRISASYFRVVGFVNTIRLYSRWACVLPVPRPATDISPHGKAECRMVRSFPWNRFGRNLRSMWHDSIWKQVITFGIQDFFFGMCRPSKRLSAPIVRDSRCIRSPCAIILYTRRAIGHR